MKQTLPEVIKQNEDLRQILLAQDGGIMKYLAEHLDAKDTNTLFNDYQNKCVDNFYEANSWNLQKIWAGDEMRRAALGEVEHLRKELHFQSALNSFLTEMPADFTEMIDQFTELYLTYAFRQNRLRWHPEGITDRIVYLEVIELFNHTGLASKCMDMILQEHHAKGKHKKTMSDLFYEFLIHQRSKQLTLGIFAQMRNAVNEMLIGKTDEQCRLMAIATMERVRGFSQQIYTDVVVDHFRATGYTKEANQRERDGEWLRDIADHTILIEYSKHIKKHSMHYYFANFVNLLKDVGRIWAAQLAVRGIDMHDLEKQVCSILNPADNPHYYVDKYYSNDLPDKYCIANSEQAEKILKDHGHMPSTSSYLEVIDKTAETEVTRKLSLTYNQLINERFLSKDTTNLETFVDTMMNNENRNDKIVWLNDPKHKFLRTLFKVFLGTSKKYAYSAILKINQGGSYSTFIQKHFVDENLKPLDFNTQGHDVGKKNVEKIERILKAVYGKIKHK